MTIANISAPKISIIIVTRNAASTLQSCLNSIYSQRYSNVEIIIQDGASTDQTVDILKSNSHRLFCWKSEPDRGIYDAMNKAIDEVTGNWVIFLGADDELLDGFSDMALELKEAHSIYYGNVIYKGMKCSGFMTPYKMVKTGMSHQSMFYSSSIFKSHRYNLNYKISADSILNMECWSDKSIKWIYKDYMIANYNHTGISSRDFDQLLKKNMSRLVFKHYGFIVWIRYKIREFKKLYRKG
ncbi:glycosyltransferase family 2 protein [Desertivirga brevis]|uniref:glycosyltransferase family 2 protein n=1 Tax=Desertivirga brevis TaxID=2810310 RepID=UPI001A97846A|nr:glycosyltransferase family 2 protein [Pedobacter sp. SYSU D00873]